MINEVVMGAEFIQYPIERLIGFFVGIGLFFHFLEMANFAHPKSPWCIGIALFAVAFSAIGLAVSALACNMQYMWNFSMASSASVLGLWLMLWHGGLHVSDFLSKKYGES